MIDETIFTDKINKLKEITQEILDESVEKRRIIGGVVHWNDLFCNEAQFILCDNNQWRYRVIIRSADPNNNNKFIQFIKENLSKKGFANVEVTLDW